MIIHLYTDGSLGFQYEAGDYVVLREDHDKHKAGEVGIVERVEPAESFLVQRIRVEMWTPELGEYWAPMLTWSWFFKPVGDPCVIRRVED